MVWCHLVDNAAGQSVAVTQVPTVNGQLSAKAPAILGLVVVHAHAVHMSASAPPHPHSSRPGANPYGALGRAELGECFVSVQGAPHQPAPYKPIHLATWMIMGCYVPFMVCIARPHGVTIVGNLGPLFAMLMEAWKSGQ